MRFYLSARHSEAVQRYHDYRAHLADELGLEPTASLQQLAVDVLRHELRPAGSSHDVAPSRPPVGGLQGLQVRYARRDDGHRDRLGDDRHRRAPARAPGLGHQPRGHRQRQGPALVAARAPVARAAARPLRPPRAPGCHEGRSPTTASSPRRGARRRRRAGRPSGGAARRLAVRTDRRRLRARHPDLVRALVLIGTYADGPTTFPHSELQRTVVEMLRAHWGLGSPCSPGRYRPGASDAVAAHLAKVLRDSADADVAAGYLEACYPIDVTALAARRVRADARPALPRRPRACPSPADGSSPPASPEPACSPWTAATTCPTPPTSTRSSSAVDEFLTTATRDSSVPAG